jgi:hypothetical protein
MSSLFLVRNLVLPLIPERKDWENFMGFPPAATTIPAVKGPRLVTYHSWAKNTGKGAYPAEREWISEKHLSIPLLITILGARAGRRWAADHFPTCP